jgi:hypothetical protein
MSVDSILHKLPKKFKRKDFIQCVGDNTEYSLPHAQNLLERAQYAGLIHRVDYGVYEKQEPELTFQEA